MTFGYPGSSSGANQVPQRSPHNHDLITTTTPTATATAQSRLSLPRCPRRRSAKRNSMTPKVYPLLGITITKGSRLFKKPSGIARRTCLPYPCETMSHRDVPGIFRYEGIAPLGDQLIASRTSRAWDWHAANVALRIVYYRLSGKRTHGYRERTKSTARSHSISSDIYTMLRE